MTNNNQKKVLVMCLADPSGNPRPRRVIELCISLGYDVSVIGFSPRKPFAGASHYTFPAPSLKLYQKLKRRLCAIATSLMPSTKIGHYLERCRFSFYYAAGTLLEGKLFDLIFVENLEILPLAFEFKNNAKIVFDAREYYPKEFEGDLWFDLFEEKRKFFLCAHFLPLCDAILTVSQGLKREYERKFALETLLYRSTPQYVEMPVSPTNPDRIRLVYHGIANRDRRLENLIEVLSLLDERFYLDLFLVGNPKYQGELQLKAASIKRVAFLEPVPFEEIIPTIGQYDIGFFYYEPTGFNIAHCLPNKFFEYVQARLMIAIGPSPDMAELVNEYECGVVAEEFSVQSMAKALNSLSAKDIDKYKYQSDRAARELCFEKESEKLIALLHYLLEKSSVKS